MSAPQCAPPCAPDFQSLPIELIQTIAYHTHVLSPADVLSLALASHTTHGLLLGPLNAPNAFDQAQHRALAGVVFCIMRRWWDAACLAIGRGYGSIHPSHLGHPLGLAAGAGSLRVVEALVKGGADPAWAGSNDPLFLACENGHTPVVEYLLQDERVDPVAQTEDNTDVLQMAAGMGHTRVVQKLLLDGRVDPTRDDAFALCIAAEEGFVEIVRLLIADGRVDPAAYSNYVLRVAARMGQASVVRLLLACDNVDPCAANSEAVRTSSTNGYAEALKVLLDDGRADPRAVGSEALRLAARNGKVAVVELLLEDGRADVCAADNYALIESAKKGHVDVVRALLRDPRVLGGDDDTMVTARVVREAADHRRVDVLELLLVEFALAVSPNLITYCLIAARNREHDDVEHLLLSLPSPT